MVFLCYFGCSRKGAKSVPTIQSPSGNAPAGDNPSKDCIQDLGKKVRSLIYELGKNQQEIKRIVTTYESELNQIKDGDGSLLDDLLFKYCLKK